MADAFLTLMQQQHKALSRFLKLLTDEQKLLATAPTPHQKLRSLTRTKQDLSKQLQQMDEQRQNIQKQRGYTTDQKGARQLCEKLGVLSQWQNFLNLVNETRTQNKINGLAIQNRLDHNQKLLTFLQQSNDNTIYDPSGQRYRMHQNKQRFDGKA